MNFGDTLRSGQAGKAVSPQCKQFGESKASELRSVHETTDVWELAAREGVTVRRSDWDGVDRLRLFGTYADGVITLYDAQIPALSETLEIEESLATELVLAHELGHHVLDASELASKPRSPWRKMLSPWGSSAETERAIEEQATHWFALELLGDRLPETARRKLRRGVEDTT
ncbi:ImmA/IrrE family metallo-endopeptidase [Haloferax namakaokahaiae]|uniref:ImmA/IrrE family metallo-endopeptidase n=1 Tax=Haloferax namakaokahaiae TaxID=1748331 RepID=A0ABD5ZDE4_9EURY